MTRQEEGLRPIEFNTREVEELVRIKNATRIQARVEAVRIISFDTVLHGEDWDYIDKETLLQHMKLIVESLKTYGEDIGSKKTQEIAQAIIDREYKEPLHMSNDLSSRDEYVDLQNETKNAIDESKSKLDIGRLQQHVNLDKERKVAQEGYVADPETYYFGKLKDSAKSITRRLESENPRENNYLLVLLGEFHNISMQIRKMIRDLEKKTMFFTIAQDGEDTACIFDHMLPNLMKKILQSVYHHKADHAIRDRDIRSIEEDFGKIIDWSRSILDQLQEYDTKPPLS